MQFNGFEIEESFVGWLSSCFNKIYEVMTRKMILMPQNLTKNTIKMPQKKPPKAVIKALRPILPKNIH